MQLMRMNGTPDAWRPSSRTRRYVRGTGTLTMFVLGAISLASFAAMIVLLARGIFEALTLTADGWPVFLVLILVTGSIGAFTAWLASGEWGHCSHLLELDWDAGRLLALTMGGVDGAPLVPTPPEHVARLGRQMRPRAWTTSFDAIRALVVARNEKRTLVVDPYGRYLRTRVEPIETLIAMPAGVTIYVDRPIFGRVREIADVLSRGLEIPVTTVDSAPRAPLPAHLREGTKVSVRFADRDPVIGYLSGATPDAYVVVLAHGESVTVAPFQVTPTL
jgi:hypothetical protein